ncbi:hypothetical protein ES705_16179 [subsurface metagenome]
MLPEDFNTLDLGIYTYNEEGGYWEKIDYVKNNYFEQTLLIKLYHFSKYQVMVSQYISPSLDSYYEMGVSAYQAYFNDNIEATTKGYLAISSTDLILPGRSGFDVEIKRIYNSSSAIQEKLIEKNKDGNKSPLDTFGYGWSMNIPWIEVTDKGKFIRLPQGQTVKIKLANGRFEYHEGVHFTVILENSNYRLILKDGKRYEFDSNGRVIRRIDPCGKNEIRYHYQGRELTRIVDSIGREIRFSYTNVGAKRLISRIEVGGRSIRYTYYSSGVLREVYDPLNRKSVYKYRSYSLKTGDYADWDNSFSITYRLDGRNNLEEYMTYHNHTTIKNLLSTGVQKNFNSVTKATTTLTRRYYYNDQLGKPTKIETSDGTQKLTTSFTYYSNGNLHTKTEPNGLNTEIIYDSSAAFPRHKVVRGVNDADGSSVGDITTGYHYNLNTGMKEWEEDPLGKRTTYYYDVLNRIVKVIFPDDDDDPSNNPYCEYNFNDTNNTCEFFNEKRVRTLFSFDGLGRLIEINKFAGNLPYGSVISTYHYDALGRIDRVTDPLGFITTYNYDGLNRVKRVTFPSESGTAPYAALTYNDSTNTVTITDEEGGIITERSDWTSQLVEARQSCRFEGETDTYYWNNYYDSFGNTIRETDPRWNQIAG